MTKSLKIVALITFIGLFFGALARWMNLEIAKFILPASMFALAFILMPFFLFWRYDLKQQKKKVDQEDA